MAVIELSLEQIIRLVRQLSPEERKLLRQVLDEDTDAWWARTHSEGEQRLRALAAERGMNWDAMSEEENIEFVDLLIHEDRPCAP